MMINVILVLGAVMTIGGIVFITIKRAERRKEVAKIDIERRRRLLTYGIS